MAKNRPDKKEPRANNAASQEPESMQNRLSEMISLLNPFQVLGMMGVKNPLGGPPPISPDTDQRRPRRWYVYAHKDEFGSIFYIGKGTGRRAWEQGARARHDFWHWYVQRHLNGKYCVEILADDLDADEAEIQEDAWMSYLDPDRLINWANYYRRNAGNPEEYAKALELREKTKQLVATAMKLEKKNPLRSIEEYRNALRAIDEYAPAFHAQKPTGLIRKIWDEMYRDEGMKGDVIVIDRLTMCLKKLGRNEEAARYADEYFAKYAYDAKLSQGIAVQKRVNKLIGRKEPRN